MAVSPNVIEVGIHNIQAVLQESAQKLVLFDFWATWCGPCKTLGPQLEALAAEYKGAFVLAKVDVDKEQELAAQFRIQSVPTVYALYKGQPVDAFQGALPVSEIRQFIDAIVDRFGIKAPLPEGPPAEPLKALRYWQDKIKANPQDGQALLAAGRLLVGFGKALDAREVFQKIDAKMPEYSAAAAALATLGLVERVNEAGGEEAVRARLAADANDLQAQYLLACGSAAKGGTLAALDALLAVIARAAAEVRDEAKKAAAVIFEAAGRDNPEVEDRRRRLARLLF